MGLVICFADDSRDDFIDWSYSSFHEFRSRLAISAGLGPLSNYRKAGGYKQFPSPDNEPIVHLLDHSDCDGELTPQQCAAVAPRLRELILGWDDDHDTGYRWRAEKLAGMMDEAAKSGISLEFS